MNNKLIRSAGGFAAGRTLGLSEEETLAAMSRQLRRQKRQDDNVTMDDVARQFAQSASSLSDVSEAAEIKGIGYADDAFVDPFGQDQGQYYDYGPNDSQYSGQQLERARSSMVDMEDRGETSQRYPEGKQKRDRYGQVVLKSGVSPQDYDSLADEVTAINEPTRRETVAPRSVLVDALGKLESAKAEQSGIQSILSRVLGGGNDSGIEDVAGRLEDNINIGPLQRKADAALAEELNARDLDNMSSRQAAYNTIKAQIEAEGIGETMYRPSSAFPGTQLPAERADAALAGIARANPRAFPEAAFNAEGIAFDPGTGNPIGQQGPVYQTSNTADSSQALNAPGPATARSWMVEQQPEYRAGGRSFGDYAQTDITGATTLFADRVRGLEGYGLEGVSPNVRSADELQAASDIILRKGAERGDKFYTREPVEGPGGKVKLKNTRQTEPDVNGVLNKLRYTPAESAQLANAMYQLEVAKSTEINQQGKQQYFTRQGPGGALTPTTFGGTPDGGPDALTSGGAGVFFGSPEAIDPRDGQASVARIRPGQQIEGADISTAFRGLKEPGARQPFIGQVVGETPRVNRYNNTGETTPEGISGVLRAKEEGFSRKTGNPVDETALRGKVTKAVLAEERSKRDAKKRREQERSISQYTMENPSNVGRMISARRRA